ncbi:Ger(x)C family spore germination protein [Cohnella suwonensis]|uniref:Ger(X)C family spore germination protein n=1 Tax=Cohnella suwonensis TaxID=696072 RepID=A0ABW0M1G8_9BACL
MRKKGLALIGAAFMCLSVTGCWDSTELNELAITSATAVDYDGEKEEWVVSYQVVIPSAISAAMSAVGGGAAKLPVIVYSTKGKTIREAVWRSAMESPRNLYFSHNRVMVVSDAAARHGLDPLLDVYYRNPDSRETVSVLMADGNARKIIEQLMQIQIIPGDGIEETIRKEAADLSALPNVRLYDLAMGIVSPAKSAVLPEILVSGSPGVTSADALNNTSLSSKLRLGRLAVLRKDKMVGWISREHTVGVAFIRDQIKATTISFACDPSQQRETSSFRLNRSTTRLAPRQSGDHWVMEIAVKGEGMLLETDCKLDLNKPEVIKKLERQLNGHIREKIIEAWSEVQKLQTDIVGFADVVHRKFPKQWKELSKNWPATFVQFDIDPQVDITIKRVGLSNKSFKNLTEKE